MDTETMYAFGWACTAVMVISIALCIMVGVNELHRVQAATEQLTIITRPVKCQAAKAEVAP